MPGLIAPGIGFPIAVDSAKLDGVNHVFAFKLYIGQNGVLVPVDDLDGLRMPVKAVLSDISDSNVKTGDLALNAQRVSIVGGASVAEFQIDDSPYDQGISGGVPAHAIYVQGVNLIEQDHAGAIRCSPDRILHTTAPPRGATSQGAQTLTSTAEITLLPSILDVYQDIAFLGIYTDNITAPVSTSVKVLFRDQTGGAVRYTVPLGEKSGSNIDFGGLRWKQTNKQNNWTVALSAAMPSPSSVFVHALSELRFSDI